MSSLKKNRLAQETSAYLLQHSSNPVEWFPWGKEALNRAQSENKPIFLSIGYSACHWCHVMEKESFEDKEIAEILKKHFISIKVDKEERPDLDHIYMSAVQALTHRGGWPLTVFLTPDLKPFYGGTYFPPQDRMGLPSFRKVLVGISQAWKTRPEEINQSAEELTKALSQMSLLGTQGVSPTGSPSDFSPQTLRAQAALEILSKQDPEFGGLGSAPKFFHTMDWRVVLRHWKNTQSEEALSAVKNTLDHWLRGGIYDQIGGGFHRYSTDRQWLVPHFEKMLYDNALVTQLFLEAYQATHTVEYAQVIRETLNYIEREMTSPLGGFFSTQDADSEGVEGKYYVWQKEEILTAFSSDLGNLLCKVYGVSTPGNWEKTNILHLPKPLAQVAVEEKMELGWLEHEISKAKSQLFQLRSKRIPPFKDEKIILAWNGLMVETFAKAFQVLGDEAYLKCAIKCANFVESFMRKESSLQLSHSFQEGKIQGSAFLDDYAYWINGLLSLFECDFDSKWLDWAEALAHTVIDEFWDPIEKSFYYSPQNHEKLIFRPKEFQDGALPSPTAMMLTGLVRLNKLLNKEDFYQKIGALFGSHWEFMKKAPLACGQMFIAFELFKNKSKEVVVISGSNDEAEKDFLDHIRGNFFPNTVAVLKTPQNTKLALLKNKTALKGSSTVYICQNNTCLAPLSSLEDLIKRIDE